MTSHPRESIADPETHNNAGAMTVAPMSPSNNLESLSSFAPVKSLSPPSLGSIRHYGEETPKTVPKLETEVLSIGNVERTSATQLNGKCETSNEGESGVQNKNESQSIPLSTPPVSNASLDLKRMQQFLGGLKDLASLLIDTQIPSQRDVSRDESNMLQNTISEIENSAKSFEKCKMMGGILSHDFNLSTLVSSAFELSLKVLDTKKSFLEETMSNADDREVHVSSQVAQNKLKQAEDNFVSTKELWGEMKSLMMSSIGNPGEPTTISDTQMESNDTNKASENQVADQIVGKSVVEVNGIERPKSTRGKKKIPRKGKRDKSSNEDFLPGPKQTFIQLLSHQSGESKDFDSRESYEGNLEQMIAKVPENDTPMSLQPIKSSTPVPPRGKTLSSNVMGVCPTMAPPMSIDKPAFPEAPDLFYNPISVPEPTPKNPGKKRRRTADSSNVEIESQRTKRRRGKSRGPEENIVEATNIKSTVKERPKIAKPVGGFNAVPTPNLAEIKALLDLQQKPKLAEIVTDANPQRVVNPLLTLPHFPPGSEVPLELIPQGGELWAVAGLHFSEPDTYPISYLARLLGSNISEDGSNQPFASSFDPASVPLSSPADPWLLEPGPGTFVDRVCKRAASSVVGSATVEGNEDESTLSKYDPLWVNILSNFRGYNDDDFISATKKEFLTFVSPKCLKFAEERSVLTKAEGVSFRSATMDDEEVLHQLSQKQNGNFSPKQNISACLRSQSSFCIIAELAGKPIGFIQYRFCLYKVEDKKSGQVQMTAYGVKSSAGNSRIAQVVELVVFVDNLVCDESLDESRTITTAEMKSPIPTPENIVTAKVILTALALEHASKENIWYGMMESPPSLIPLLIKYFRMSQVDDQGDSGNCTRIPLACDLKKCNYRYAILCLEEIIQSTKTSLPSVKPSSRLGNTSERLLIHLPENTAVMKIAENSPESAVDSSKLDGLELSSETPISYKRLPTFSNSGEESRSYSVQVQLVRKNEESCELDGIPVAIHSRSTHGGLDNLTQIDPSTLEISGNWNILRSYPLKADMPKEADENKSEGDGVTGGSFLTYLKKKQDDLEKLESSIQNISRNLLTKAYEERLAYESEDRDVKRNRIEKILRDYDTVVERRREADLAWQSQLEQDMDAVCDICFDGEVTPENQIIFCDSCNVAVHQRCYGIDKVPSGNYFCNPCTYFEVEKEFLAAERRDGPRSTPTRLPIVCELCPRRQGAFVQVKYEKPTRKAKWVHTVCAKWHGMGYVDLHEKNQIEDLSLLKSFFKEKECSCDLCQSKIGAMHQCRVEGCNKYMHITCARSIGECTVEHGEDTNLDTESTSKQPWTLACQEHSDVDKESIREGSLSADQLVTIAKSYPPEPVPQKEFFKMNGKERKEYWADSDNLADFFDTVMPSLDGTKCAICDQFIDPKTDEHCSKCGIVFHPSCFICPKNSTNDGDLVCVACQYTLDEESSSDYEAPHCHMCDQPGGPLVRSHAKPMSMKKWKKPRELNRSLFGPNKFVHALCGMWNSACSIKTMESGGGQVLHCSNLIMACGKRHVTHQHRCVLCGMSNGVKVDCAEKGCTSLGGHPSRFHVTCARQAGFELTDDFTVKCFNHVRCELVFRARLEDMLEIELERSPDKSLRVNTPMSWAHASALFHAAVGVLRILGWAWRWAEWWVEFGDNWEPLLEQGQVESEMTKEELKIVDSTADGRCIDARCCRLAAFGAALRNRDYDKEDGDDREPLERALKAVLSTPTLVGPLKKNEIDFFVTWLALAYRSKSQLLGFGDEKTPVACDKFCAHIADGSPKYELGTRPLPGKNAPPRGPFEPLVEEEDDFLRNPTSSVSKTKSSSKDKKTRKRRTFKAKQEVHGSLSDESD